jgi:hypothetical protein
LKAHPRAHKKEEKLWKNMSTYSMKVVKTCVTY